MNRPSPHPDASYQEVNVVSLRRQDSVDYGVNRGRSEDKGAAIRRIYAGLMRRWLVVVPIFLAVFLLTFAIGISSPQIYSASTLIVVSPQQERVLAEGQLLDRGGGAGQPAEVASEIEVLRSPMLIRRLVATLELQKDPEWNEDLRPKTILDYTVRPVMGMVVGFFKPPPASGGGAGADATINRVAETVGFAIKVRQRGQSYGIEVTAEAQTPDGAARIANTLVSLYMQSQTETRFSSAQRAGSWLSERLDELRAEVLAKERAAETFRVRHGLSLASGGDQQAQSGEVQSMLVAARADLAERTAKLRQVETLIRNGGSAESMADALNSASVVQLRSQAGDAARRLAELQQRYSDEHPAVRAAMTELQNTRSQIQEEVSRIVGNFRNEVEVSRARLSTLEQNFGSADGVRGENSDAIIQYRELVRQAAAARQVHEGFLQRFHEVANQGELPVANSRLVSDATPPRFPIRPSLGMTLINALLLGLFVGIAVGLLMDMLDNSLSTSEDVEHKIGVSALVSVPLLHAKDFKGLPEFRQNPLDYLADKPMSGYAESLRVLRSSLIHAHGDKKLRVVALTSALPQEGKTTVSMCLARVAAMSGQKVVLVDCDLRHPAVSQVLGFDSDQGLFEVLTNGVDWRQAIRQDPETHARVLPTVASQFSPRDVFSSQSMQRLMAELRAECDLVILDCPPILAVAETRTLVTHADSVVLVARAQKTPVAAVRAALREVELTGSEVMGVALNGVDFRSPGQLGFGNSLYYNEAAQRYYRS
ncbi:MAG: AAA family ATPase [Hyphomonadaceae bacterium]|nr:AAA family ATPase [Hyphomonadaceae bacterium]